MVYSDGDVRAYAGRLGFKFFYQDLATFELVISLLPCVRIHAIDIKESSTRTQFTGEPGLRGADVAIKSNVGLLFKFSRRRDGTQSPSQQQRGKKSKNTNSSHGILEICLFS